MEGFISFEPQETGVSKVIVQVIDICGAFTEQEFVFESLKCSCEGQNGGYCVLEDQTQSEMKCLCPGGCVKDGLVVVLGAFLLV